MIASVLHNGTPLLRMPQTLQGTQLEGAKAKVSVLLQNQQLQILDRLFCFLRGFGLVLFACFQFCDRSHTCQATMYSFRIPWLLQIKTLLFILKRYLNYQISKVVGELICVFYFCNFVHYCVQKSENNFQELPTPFYLGIDLRSLGLYPLTHLAIPNFTFSDLLRVLSFYSYEYFDTLCLRVVHTIQ